LLGGGAGGGARRPAARPGGLAPIPGELGGLIPAGGVLQRRAAQARRRILLRADDEVARLVGVEEPAADVAHEAAVEPLDPLDLVGEGMAVAAGTRRLRGDLRPRPRRAAGGQGGGGGGAGGSAGVALGRLRGPAAARGSAALASSPWPGSAPDTWPTSIGASAPPITCTPTSVANS